MESKKQRSLFKTVISLLLAFVMVFTLLPIIALAEDMTDPTGDWQTDESGRVSYYVDNAPLKNGWREIDGKLYYFTEDGYLFSQTGKQLVGEDYYYFETGEDGKTYAVTGIKTAESGETNYFAPEMKYSTWDAKKQYYFDNTGNRFKGLKEDGGYYYYLQPKKLTKDWKTVDDKLYYFTADGRMFDKTGKQKIGKNYYYFEKASDGKTYAVTGIKTAESGETNYFTPSMQCSTWDANKQYYFDSTGNRVKGLKKIGDYYYYLQPKKLTAAWKTVNDHKYHFKNNGQNSKGMVKVDDYYYYFAPYAKTGVQKINGVLYYFKTNGKRTTATGWFKDGDGNYRYGLGNGKIASGFKTINGKTYFFNTKTGVKRTATGFFTYNQHRYYTKSGVVQTGWKAINNKAYYFYKSGSNKYAQAKNTTIGYLKIPKSGYLGEAYVRGIKALDKSGWTLKNAYNTSAGLKYAHREMRGNSSEELACYAFKNGQGNCYCMAATFYVQAKLLGYNVRQIEGKVYHTNPHSWTQIKQDGEWWVYDPNFTNETGRNGWKITYGAKGTWVYTDYHVFQK